MGIRLDQANARIKELEGQLASCQTELQQKKQQVTDLTKTNADKDVEISLLHDEINDITVELSTVRSQLAACQEEVKRLNDLLEAEPEPPKPVGKAHIGQFFRDGILNEGAGDGGVVTEAEMNRLGADVNWMWRHYLQAPGGIDSRLSYALAAEYGNYISTHVPKNFADVAAGKYDAGILDYTKKVLIPVANRGLLWIHNIQHEPENDESISDEGQRGDRYVAMVKHVMELMASVGFTPQSLEAAGGLWTGPALTEAYYREDRWKRWINFPAGQFGPNGILAADLYNRYGSKTRDRTKTLGEKWQDFLQADGNGLADDFKRVCGILNMRGAILETGWHEDPRDPEFQKGREAAQMPKIVQAVKDGWLAGYCRSNVNAIFSGTYVQNYRVSSTPETDQAFKDMVHDAVWL